LRQTRQTAARPYGRLLTGETVWLMVCASAGPKGGSPPEWPSSPAADPVRSAPPPASTSAGQERIAPRTQRCRGNPQAAGYRLKVLAAQQPQNRRGLARPRHPAAAPG